MAKRLSADERVLIEARSRGALRGFLEGSAEEADRMVFNFRVREATQRLANGYYVEFSIRKHKRPSAQKLAAQKRSRKPDAGKGRP